MVPVTTDPIIPEKKHDDAAGYLHRQVIGYLGLLLPFTIWAIAGGRSTTGLTDWELLTSISAYYYTGATAIFTGILAALAVFLFIYRGYKNKFALRDRIAAWIAGTSAVAVALFPTAAPIDSLKLSWWESSTGKIHGIAASMLFLDFAYFSLFLFTKSNPEAPSARSTDKKVRNGIYIFCGVVMLVCIAISWLAKGRAEQTALRLAGRTLHYVIHPTKFKADLAGAIQELKTPPNSGS